MNKRKSYIDNLDHNEKSLNMRKLKLTYERALALAAAVGVMTLFISNIEMLVEKLDRAVDSIAARHEENPILLNLVISDPKRKFRLDRLREDTSCLLDITVTYDGKRKLFIREFELRHYEGIAHTMTTGKLESTAKYKFIYLPNQYLVSPLEPPLVINPMDAQTINFQIEIAPKGEFPNSAGSLYAKLKYQFEDGSKGSLPLVVVKETDQHTVSFPILSEGTMEPRYENFRITQNGNIIGKSY